MSYGLRGIVCFLVAVALCAAGTANAAPVVGAKPSAVKSGQKKPKLKEYVIPGLIDPVHEFTPKKPETPADKKRREALAWFMTGQIREKRNDFRGAYDAYRQAVQLDPKAVEVYRSLVPLAFRMNRNKEAIEFATKAVSLDPDDYQLARTLAIFMASQRRIPEAVKLLETAAKSKRIGKRSGEYVTVQRDLGLLYRALGAKDKAADSYRVVFNARLHPERYEMDAETQRRLDDDPISSYERIGQVFLEAGRTADAEKAFVAAQKDRKGKPGSLNFNLAKVYFQTKQYGKARAQLQKYLDGQLQTKGREAYELLAEILKAQGKEKELLGVLETAAKKDSRNETLQYFLAEQYVVAGKLKEAEALYKKTMAGSNDPVALLGLAAIYRKQKRTQDWLKALEGGVSGARDADQLEKNLAEVEKEVKEAGTSKKFVQKLISEGRKQASGKKPTLNFAGSLVLAKLAEEAHDNKAVTQFYRFALKQKPAFAETIYSDLGSYLLMADQFAESAAVFEEASKHPDLARSRPNFLFRLSQAQELAGKTDLALKAIHDAQKILPGIALLQYQEGWIYYHARKWDKAIPIFEKVIKENPSSRDIVKRCRMSLSNVYVLKGDITKGMAVLEKVYEENPDDISVNNDLGYLWADNDKNLEQAEKMIRKAVKAEPENAAYLDSLGWVLYKLGRYKEALPPLEKAVKKPNGGDATIWEHLGDVYSKLNRKKDARSAWNKALKKAAEDRFKDDKLIKSLKKKLGGAGKEPVEAKPPKRK